MASSRLVQRRLIRLLRFCPADQMPSWNLCSKFCCLWQRISSWELVPHNNSEDFRNFIYFVECMIDCYVQTLVKVVGRASLWRMSFCFKACGGLPVVEGAGLPVAEGAGLLVAGLTAHQCLTESAGIKLDGSGQ
ncbi:hypothetical protein ACFX2I_023063 [Malus domestica]